MTLRHSIPRIQTERKPRASFLFTARHARDVDTAQTVHTNLRRACSVFCVLPPCQRHKMNNLCARATPCSTVVEEEEEESMFKPIQVCLGLSRAEPDGWIRIGAILERSALLRSTAAAAAAAAAKRAPKQLDNFSFVRLFASFERLSPAVSCDSCASNRRASIRFTFFRISKISLGSRSLLVFAAASMGTRIHASPHLSTVYHRGRRGSHGLQTVRHCGKTKRRRQPDGQRLDFY